MKTTTRVTPHTWFWIVNVVSLRWSPMGVFAYLAHAYIFMKDLEQIFRTQQGLVYEPPHTWVTGAYAITVWGGNL